MDTINVKLQHEDNSVNSVSNFQQTYQRDLIGFVDRTLVNKHQINDSIQLKNDGIGSKNDTVFFNRYVENERINNKNTSDFDVDRFETKKTINTFESKDEKKMSDNIISKQEVAELVTESDENMQIIDNKLNDKLTKNTHKTIDKNVEFLKDRKVPFLNSCTLKTSSGWLKYLKFINQRQRTLRKFKNIDI